METATISRSELYKKNRNIKFAFTYLYTVDYGRVLPSVGARTADFSTLASAHAACKRNGFVGVEDWKPLDARNRMAQLGSSA